MAVVRWKENGILDSTVVPLNQKIIHFSIDMCLVDIVASGGSENRLFCRTEIEIDCSF